MKSNTFLLIFILQAGILSGCSSVTPQTVELSATTAERLSTLRDVHIETTNQYFDEQVKRANEFEYLIDMYSQAIKTIDWEKDNLDKYFSDIFYDISTFYIETKKL